jgi:hypothetical protein
MSELFRIPRLALPPLTRRTVWLAVAGLIVLAMVITPGVSSAAKVFTLKKAARISLGNTTTATVAGTAAAESVTPVTVLCPPNHQATNGGADSPVLAASGGEYPWMIVTAPVVGGSTSLGWYVEIFNQFSNPVPFTAWAVCAP